MKYAYHDLYTEQFERVVLEICHELFGAGVEEFATGPDGGRDGKFVGVANEFPSKAAPWSGTTIIQAKHTISPVAKFSDGDFSGDSKSSVLTKEIPRIKKLHESGELDHYVLFTNRRKGGNAGQEITKRIKDEAGVASAQLVGVEDLERYLKRYPVAASGIQDAVLDSPLRVSPEQLAQVITAIAESGVTGSLKPTDLQRVKFKAKNKVNGLSSEFAEFITRRVLKDFEIVRKFLANPANANYQTLYDEAATELQATIIQHRSRYDSFDGLLNYVLAGLSERDSDVREQKKLARTVLYFMYWQCDVGKRHESK